MPTQESKIEIVPYDPGWPGAFEAEAARLRTALKTLALRIDHHGSTAIPGLGAKPIIDIQMSVATLQPLSAYGAEARSHWIHSRAASRRSFCPFFHRPIQWPHSHHVHVVERGGHEERRTLAFRDYLRDHPDVAREYEDLKRTVAAQIVTADPESQERVCCWPRLISSSESSPSRSQGDIPETGQINGLPNTQMEPTRLTVCAIMSPRRAAHLQRWADKNAEARQMAQGRRLR